MTTPTLKSIQYTLNQYDHQLQSLPVPSLKSYAATATDSSFSASSLSSPYLLKFKLNQLSNNINNLFLAFKSLDSSHTNKAQYNDLSHQFNYLINDFLDERMFIVNQLISEFELSNTPTPLATPSSSGSSSTEQELSSHAAVSGPPNPAATSLATGSKTSEGEDLTSLRQRLLSSKSSKLDESHKSTSHLNDYHESLQSDIINELSELTSSLRNSAYTLSSKILNDDQSALNETQENMVKNVNFFSVVNKNLNSYLNGKGNSKISLWFLIKVGVALLLSFIVIMFLIILLPKL